MRVKELTIRMVESYEPNPGQFSGKVKLEGDGSTQELKLSALSISKIFGVIQEDIKAEAMRCAASTPKALEDAHIQPTLIEASAVSQIDVIPF